MRKVANENETYTKLDRIGDLCIVVALLAYTLKII
jgi:hypothetical protein